MPTVLQQQYLFYALRQPPHIRWLPRLPQYYQYYIHGSLSAGPVSAPESVQWLCLQAAVARVQALNLAGIDNNSISWRKIPSDRILGSLKAGGQGIPLPGVILFPIEETQVNSFNQLDDVTYPIGCLLVDKGNQDPLLQHNLPTFLQWRQQINRAFRWQGQGQIPNLPPSIVDVVVQPRVLYDRPAWTANLDVSYLIINFISREPRGLNR